MAVRNQADFIITNACIHRGPIAWKLVASSADLRTAVRTFSIRVFDTLRAASNKNAAPVFIYDNLEPIESDRSAFGVLQPVSQRPTETG